MAVAVRVEWVETAPPCRLTAPGPPQCDIQQYSSRGGPNCSHVARAGEAGGGGFRRHSHAPTVNVVLNLGLGVLALAMQLAVVARPPLQKVGVCAPVAAVAAEEAPAACRGPPSAGAHVWPASGSIASVLINKNVNVRFTRHIHMNQGNSD